MCCQTDVDEWNLSFAIWNNYETHVLWHVIIKGRYVSIRMFGKGGFKIEDICLTEVIIVCNMKQSRNTRFKTYYNK